MKKTTKVISLSLLMIACIFSMVACGKKEYYVDLSEREILSSTYKTVDGLWEDIQCREIGISLPEKSEMTTYTIVENILYYNVQYTSYFEDSIDLGAPEFTQKYCSQIRKYNIETGADDLLYQYANDYCMNISDLQCNGKILIWEDYPRGKWWNLKCMDLVTGQVSDILEQSEGENGFTTITPQIVEDGIYWYNADSENNTDMFYYDFDSKTIDVVFGDVYIMSPYIRPSVINNILTYCKKTEDGVCEIYSLDLKTQKERCLSVTTEVRDAMSNDQICAWMTGYETSDCKYIYVFDFEKETLDRIEVGRAFSFAVIDNMVVVNEREKQKGIYGFDVKRKEVIF